MEWGVYGVPETFLVGRDGKIAYKLVGPITEANLERVLKPEIEKALAASLSVRHDLPQISLCGTGHPAGQGGNHASHIRAMLALGLRSRPRAYPPAWRSRFDINSRKDTRRVPDRRARASDHQGPPYKARRL
jgi:hypothetical protein